MALMHEEGLHQAVKDDRNWISKKREVRHTSQSPRLERGHERVWGVVGP